MKLLFKIAFVTALFSASASVFANPDTDIEKEKVREAFRRMFETAHPTPVEQKVHKGYSVPLSEKTNLPSFLNVSAIDSEEEIGVGQRMQNESSIAVNPKNPLNLIASAVDYRDNSASWVYVSSDGGRTWINHNLGRPFPEWRSSNDPSVAFDADGVGYLVYGAHGIREGSLGENAVYISRTTDEGKTWEAHKPIIVHTGEQELDDPFEDKYYITVDNSPSSPHFKDLYIPWKRVTPLDSATQIVIVKSSDKGDTWTEPVNVSHRLAGTSEDTTYGQSFPLTTLGPNGEVYVVWNHGIEHGVGFAKSTDELKTFTDPRIIQRYNIFGETKYLAGQKGYRHSLKGVVRCETYPVIVCDVYTEERNGYLYLSWAGDNVPNIYFSRSTDQGETWSDPLIIHSDSTNDQFWQWLSIDPLTGDLAIMYLDSRNDPENIMVECYVAYSSDGGLTWIDRRVSDINSDIRLNPFSGNSFAGDYSGAAFYNGLIYPSWVDMRNALEYIYDSDVYTAVVNTKAPGTPLDFEAQILPEETDKIQLSWKPVSKLAFGQPLGDQKLFYRLYQGDELLANLDSDVDSYDVEGLEPHEYYEFSIYSVLGEPDNIGSDSSMRVADGAYAGGSRNPGQPGIVYAEGSDDKIVTMHVRMPQTREDSITALVNLDKAVIYRDGEQLKEVNLETADAGKVMTFTDTPDEIGYYSYSVKIFDDNGNESKSSPDYILYTGPMKYSLLYDFDDAVLPKFQIDGKWGITSELGFSKPYSLTDAPNEDYERNVVTTLQLFPIIKHAEGETFFLEFKHAAIVEKNDEAIVEYSFDKGASWTEAIKFNKLDYEPWADNTLNQMDWKSAHILIENESAEDTLYVRFKLTSDVIKHNAGWFIDDITLGGTLVNVEEQYEQSSFNIYPNPATEMIYVHFENDYLDGRLNLYNIYGALLNSFSGITNDYRVDLSGLPSGVYLVEYISKSGRKIQSQFCKVK